jgi:hypothetical protein
MRHPRHRLAPLAGPLPPPILSSMLTLGLALALPTTAALAQPRSPRSQSPQEATTCVTQTIACGQTINGSLDPGDCKLADGTAIDYFDFAGTLGETVTATLASTDFVPLVRLLDASGHTWTSNQGPGSTQIQFTLNSTGTWTVAANNAEPSFKSGNYTLSLHCSAPPSCVASDTTLCLGANGRFAVKADFDTGSGNAGTAHVGGLTLDTGYLWFFSPSNVEIVVKVLDACTLSGKFWVFAGGLTNVGVRMTVTDTSTSTTNTYATHPNTTFQPIQDTSAFSTCP